jgi:hypothetical protein
MQGDDVHTSIPAAGGGRFLKTLLCVHDDGGSVVVKVRWSRGSARRSAPTTHIFLASLPLGPCSGRGAGESKGALCSRPTPAAAAAGLLQARRHALAGALQAAAAGHQVSRCQQRHLGLGRAPSSQPLLHRQGPAHPAHAQLTKPNPEHLAGTALPPLLLPTHHPHCRRPQVAPDGHRLPARLAHPVLPGDAQRRLHGAPALLRQPLRPPLHAPLPQRHREGAGRLGAAGGASGRVEAGSGWWSRAVAATGPGARRQGCSRRPRWQPASKLGGAGVPCRRASCTCARGQQRPAPRQPSPSPRSAGWRSSCCTA